MSLLDTFSIEPLFGPRNKAPEYIIEDPVVEHLVVFGIGTAERARDSVSNSITVQFPAFAEEATTAANAATVSEQQTGAQVVSFAENTSYLDAARASVHAIRQEMATEGNVVHVSDYQRAVPGQTGVGYDQEAA